MRALSSAPLSGILVSGLLMIYGCARHDRFVAVPMTGDLNLKPQFAGRWYDGHSGRSWFLISATPATLSMRVETHNPFIRPVRAESANGVIRVELASRENQIASLYLAPCPDNSLAVAWNSPESKKCSTPIHLVTDVSWRWRFDDLKASYQK